MTIRTVGGQALRVRRRGLLWWGMGLLALVAMNIGFYPAVPDAEELQGLLEGVPDAMLAIFGITGADDLFSPAGYLDSQLFALMSPLLLIIFVVGAVNATLPSEEEAGTLELLLANPVSRRRVIAGKGAAVLGMVAVLVAVHLVGTLVASLAVGLEIGVGELVAAHVSLLLLVAAIGAVALAAAGATGRRGATLGLTAAVAVVAYLVDSFAPLVEWLEALRPASLFYLYRGNAPLENGLDPVHALALAAVTVVLTAVAVVAFDRRDIGT